MTTSLRATHGGKPYGHHMSPRGRAVLATCRPVAKTIRWPCGLPPRVIPWFVHKIIVRMRAPFLQLWLRKCHFYQSLFKYCHFGQRVQEKLTTAWNFGGKYPLRPYYTCPCDWCFSFFSFADIDECKEKGVAYPCSVRGTCINTVGGFQCSCPANTPGSAYNGTCEAKKSEPSFSKTQKSVLPWQVAVGTPSPCLCFVHIYMNIYTDDLSSPRVFFYLL